jgi:FkbH-like protein
MFEAEVNGRVEGPDTIPSGILARFREYRGQVAARTLLPWGEHCTECAWPSCYQSCELYDPRIDGACRQFEGGVVRIPTAGGAAPYIQKITFRRWAKLWALGNVDCHSLEAAERAEQINLAAGAVARLAPLPRGLRERVMHKVSYIRRQQLAEKVAGGSAPDCLVIEIFNPNERVVDLTLSIRDRREPDGRRFQRLVTAPPGFTRDKVPVAAINHVTSTAGVFEIELVPNDAEGLTLYFGLIDFVKELRAEAHPAPASEVAEPEPSPAPAAKCKCVVWDLDHTLWDGVLIEDGPDAIRLKAGIVGVIKELDSRGILQSIASKNNRDDVLPVLEKLGVAEYFLHPQIHWQPKSQSIGAVARALNIGVDSLLFIDDQEFERQEVASVWPQVRVVDARTYRDLAGRPEFDGPVTDESRMRRLMYRQEDQRTALQESHAGNYLGFLRESSIQLELAPLQESNLQRVYELAQRTNQMNFSGNRYSMDQLRQVAADPTLDTYVLRCRDRFGSYGIVGFSVVRRDPARMLDLMFSCRVQGKRVEHAFLAWLLRKYIANPQRDFLADLRRTKKNAPSAAVFADMGFEEVATAEGLTTLR